MFLVLLMKWNVIIVDDFICFLFCILLLDLATRYIGLLVLDCCADCFWLVLSIVAYFWVLLFGVFVVDCLWFWWFICCYYLIVGVCGFVCLFWWFCDVRVWIGGFVVLCFVVGFLFDVWLVFMSWLNVCVLLLRLSCWFMIWEFALHCGLLGCL